MRAQSLQPLPQLLVGSRESHPYVVVAVRSEGDAGNYGGVAASQKALGEFERSLAGRADVDQRVESALRRCRQQPGIAEHLDHDVTPAPESLAKLDDALLVSGERGLAGLLRDRLGAAGNRLLQAGDDG